MAMSAALLLAMYFLFILVFAIGVCWLWPDFVDNSDPPRIRAALLMILCFATGFEVVIWLTGIVKSWVLVLVLVTNLWGMGDAFLRFPVVKDIDSLFGLKQILLFITRILGYALGFRDIGTHVGWFILIMLACIFTVPICWLTALPIGDAASMHMKNDAVDVDILVRIWRIITDSKDRSETMARFRRQTLLTMAGLCQAMPFLTPVASRVDPSVERLLRKKTAV